jgi:hypothetical protein
VPCKPGCEGKKGKSGESPALSRNCNPDFGEARIPSLIEALKTFEERG